VYQRGLEFAPGLKTALLARDGEKHGSSEKKNFAVAARHAPFR
jgi:hypothetical protein